MSSGPSHSVTPKRSASIPSGLSVALTLGLDLVMPWESAAVHALLDGILEATALQAALRLVPLHLKVLP